MTSLAKARSNLRPTNLVSCEFVDSQEGHEHGTRVTPVVRSRYQAMTSEDIEDFMCAAVTLIFRVGKSVRLL
jgi:hypothetical protein